MPYVSEHAATSSHQPDILVTMGRNDWSANELDVVVSTYMEMLQAESRGIPYVKAQHNRDVQQATGRSKGSIEFKFCFDGWSWSCEDKRWLPLYEAKMLNLFDHRFSTYAGATQAELNMQTLPLISQTAHDDPNQEARARYWVAEAAVDESLARWSPRGWLFGWRKITGATVLRTHIDFVFPRSAAGDSALLIDCETDAAVDLLASLSSLAHDYISRQKLSGANMQFYLVKQFAAPMPSTYSHVPRWIRESLHAWVKPRVLELVYTSYRIAPFARDLGDTGLPFRWLPERREAIRAELDAAMMHVYGLKRDEVEHILDSFFVVRRYEERDYGEFRTKRLVLTEYDRMAEAAATGVPYESSLDPAPGFGPRHDASTIPDWFKEQA
jgi:hypothetical protein